MRYYNVSAAVPYPELCDAREISISYSTRNRRKALRLMRSAAKRFGELFGQFVTRVDEVRGSYVRTIAVLES